MAADVQKITGTEALVAARLCNFQTGSSEPLATHQQWLQTEVKKVVSATPNAWIDILGHASRQWKHTNGPTSHQLNKLLSMERCERVKARIAKFGSQARFNLEQARGDRESQMPNPDDGYDRAVEVLVYAAKTQPPPQPKPSPKPTVTAQKFEIRIVEGLSPGYLGVQVDEYFFQIVDVTRRLTAKFKYMGFGGSIGIPLPKIPDLPGAYTRSGPPSPFTTSRHTELYMFNKLADFYQDLGAAVGPFSFGGTGRLLIKDLSDDQGLILIHPRIIPVEGGNAIQLPSISATSGLLILDSAVTPFTGY